MSEQEKLMRKIYMYAFACRDCALFLDTHPRDKDAIEYFRDNKAALDKAKKEYTEKFGPISYDDNVDRNEWKWATQKWPWQVND